MTQEAHGTQAHGSPSAGAPDTRTFAMTDVVRQFRELAEESVRNPDFVHDTVIIGGGAAGAGVLRDIASRGNGSAVLVDRGPFGGETSSKTGKAIHPGIRYLRMGFHRLLLAFGLRRDPKIKQGFVQNIRSAWLDLKLVWYGTRERKILIETSGQTVEEIPNIVFVLPDSPEKKWAVFFGITLYDFLTAVWAWCGLSPRSSRVKLFLTGASVHRRLSNLAAESVLGAILYWDGKTSNDKILVLKVIRDAYLRGSAPVPIRALSFVEVEGYDWVPDGPTGCFRVTLTRRFEHDELPESVTVKAHTITNASGPWVDQARNRTARPDGKQSVVYSRGSHLEATNEFIHQSLTDNPHLQVGLVPLNEERQHYLRPFHQNGIWYIQCTTTDRPHTDPDLVVPLEDEIEELLHSYNQLVADRWKIDRRDVFNVFCGIRPLALSTGGEIAVKDISRMFRINRTKHGDGVVYDMVNVKLTEFRWVGHEVGELIAKELRRKRVKQLGRSTTQRLPFLPVADEERFAIQRPDHPRGDREFVREKVRHYVHHQMVNSYADYMLNTGGVRDAVVFDGAGRCDLDVTVLDLMLDEMAAQLGWSAERRRREWDRFADVYDRNMAHCDLRARGFGTTTWPWPPPRCRTPMSASEGMSANAGVYGEDDASLDDLDGEVVAVIGYGIQGKAFAANLRDSGVPVVVGNRDDEYRETALEDGFDTRPIAEAAAAASVVLLLIPDEAHPEVFATQIAPHLRAGDLFLLAHGFSVRYQRITSPSDVDVALLAPKMFGKPIRQHYLAGSGVLAFVDVIQDATGSALARTLAVAKAVGFTRYGVLPVSCSTETELDLFQEQFLTPLLIDAVRMAFDVLVDAGYAPIPSLLDMHASGEMAEMMTEAVSAGLFEVIEQQGSPTCRFGVQRYLGTLLGEDVRAKGHEILDDIRGGDFVAALDKDAEADHPSLAVYRAMYRDSAVTTAHDQLRAMLGPR